MKGKKWIHFIYKTYLKGAFLWVDDTRDELLYVQLFPCYSIILVAGERVIETKKTEKEEKK